MCGTHITWEVEAGGSGVKGQRQPVEAGLGYRVKLLSTKQVFSPDNKWQGKPNYYFRNVKVKAQGGLCVFLCKRHCLLSFANALASRQPLQQGD